MKRYAVYRQESPIATGETSAKRDEYGQQSGRIEWCRANLVKVGEADTMEEARRFAVAPVLESR